MLFTNIKQYSLIHQSTTMDIVNFIPEFLDYDDEESDTLCIQEPLKITDIEDIVSYCNGHPFFTKLLIASVPDEAIPTISQLISALENIIQLELFSCHEEILQSINGNKKITHLVMECQDHNENVIEDADKFIEILAQNTNLTTLKLSGLNIWKPISIHLKSHPTLLNFQIMHSKDKTLNEVNDLANYLTDNATLQNLDISYYKFEDNVEFENFCKALTNNKVLKGLNFSGNKLSKNMISLFNKYLTENNTLTHLNLSKVTDHTNIEGITQIFNNNTTLVALDISYNIYSQSVWNDLYQYSLKNTSLTTLKTSVQLPDKLQQQLYHNMNQKKVNQKRSAYFDTEDDQIIASSKLKLSLEAFYKTSLNLFAL